MTRSNLMDEIRGALAAAKSRLYVADRTDDCLLVKDSTTGVEYTLVVEDDDTTRKWRPQEKLRPPGRPLSYNDPESW